MLLGSVKVTSALYKTNMENRIITFFIPDSGTKGRNSEGFIKTPGRTGSQVPDPGWVASLLPTDAERGVSWLMPPDPEGFS